MRTYLYELFYNVIKADFCSNLMRPCVLHEHADPGEWTFSPPAAMIVRLRTLDTTMAR